MITLKNPSAASEWIIDLKEYPQVENSLPMAGLNVRNDSNIVAYVDLDGLKVGEVQRYSADPFQGRNYSLIRIYNPDGQNFAPNDLFIQALKGEVMGSQPFNPQWDMMFDDLTRYSTGTDSRISITSTVNMAIIKYWLNAHSSLVVQRSLTIQAHATLLGDISITLGGSNVLHVAVGIGTPPPIDTQLHKSSLSASDFDYSETNAFILGYMIDYLNVIRLPAGNITVDLMGNGELAIDGDIDTHADQYGSPSTSYVSVLEYTFTAASDLTNVNLYFKIHQNNAGVGLVRLQRWTGDAWINIFDDLPTDVPNTWETKFYTQSVSCSGVLKIRFLLRSSDGNTTSIKLYDVSIF